SRVDEGSGHVSEAEPETSRPRPGRRRAASIAAGALAVALLAGCGSWGGSRSDAEPRRPVPIGTMAARPNIVFILADDLSSNLVRYMPNVRAMARRGASFSNYYVTDSLCCPSRTSIFTGLLPHDSGVYANSGPD